MENTNLPTFDESTVVLLVDDVEQEEIESTEVEPQEEVEVDEPDESGESDESDDSVEGDPLALSVYESLVEKGVLQSREEFDGTFDFIENEMSSLPEKLLEKRISELPEYSQQLLKYISTAGQNLQREELDSFIREFINEQDVPDVSTADEARAFLETKLKDQGLRPAAIQAQLDELEDSDELISEAEKILAKEQKKTDKLIQDKAQENEQITQAQKDYYTAIQSAVTETKWAKPKQEKVLATMPKANAILQDVINQPKAYVQLIDFFSKFNGKEFDLEDYLKQGESRTTSNIKSKLEKAGYSSATSKTSSTTEQPNKDRFKDYKLIV